MLARETLRRYRWDRISKHQGQREIEGIVLARAIVFPALDSCGFCEPEKNQEFGVASTRKHIGLRKYFRTAVPVVAS